MTEVLCLFLPLLHQLHGTRKGGGAARGCVLFFEQIVQFSRVNHTLQVIRPREIINSSFFLQSNCHNRALDWICRATRKYQAQLDEQRGFERKCYCTKIDTMRLQPL